MGAGDERGSSSPGLAGRQRGDVVILGLAMASSAAEWVLANLQVRGGLVCIRAAI
jgi:hypothetical protein